jgi:hypothetical protein
MFFPLHWLHRFDLSMEIQFDESEETYYSWVVGTRSLFLWASWDYRQLVGVVWELHNCGVNIGRDS